MHTPRGSICVLTFAVSSAMLIVPLTSSPQNAAPASSFTAKSFGQSYPRFHHLTQGAPPLLGPPILSPTGSTSTTSVPAIAVADFNGDGKLDVIVVNESTSQTQNATIAVLLGNGDGTFQSPKTYDSGASYSWVAVGDVNNDGKTDIITAHGEIGVMLGNGDGTFQTMTDVTANAGALAIADVNNDGKPDLLVASYEGLNGDSSLGVLLGNGDGTFQPQVNYDTPTGENAVSIAVADFNGDGNPDIAIANTCDECGDFFFAQVDIFLGNGDGTFQTATVISPLGAYGASVYVTDINKDGKPDLVIASVCSDHTCAIDTSVGVLLGNGDGSFQSSPGADTGTREINWATAGDVDGDGNPDVIAATSAGYVVVALGNGDGTFQSPLDYSTDGDPSQIVMGDFNGDHKTDVVAVNACTGNPCSQEGDVALLLNVIGDAAVMLSPASLNFNSQAVNIPSIAQMVTLTDYGGSALQLTSIAAVGNFSETNNCPIGRTLGINASCTISVTFTPGATGSRSGSINVADSAPDNPQSLPLRGVGDDFSLASSPPSVTVTPGQAANYTVTASAIGEFTQNISFACSGQPTGSTCTISPGTASLASGLATVSVAIVTTGSSSGSLIPQNGYGNWLAAFFLLPGLMALSVQRKTRRHVARHAWLLLCGVAMCLGTSSCGSSSSGGNSSGTQAGTYTVTISAVYSSGGASLQHSALLKLIVQ